MPPSRTRPTAPSRSPATCWASASMSSASPSTGPSRTASAWTSRAAATRKELARVIEGVPNVQVVAEFAFGTSDKSPLGSPSEKGRIGNVHFALGDNKNAYPGGQNSSPLAPRRRASQRHAGDHRGRQGRLHLPRRQVGRLGGVHVVPLEDVRADRATGRQLEPRHPDRRACRLGLRAGLLVVRARIPPRRCCPTRPRSWPTCVSGHGELAHGRRLRALSVPAPRCTSRPASGTPSSTPATSRSRWCSPSRIPTTRRPSGVTLRADGGEA